MKISNETKIGALTSIAIVFLILGFNFLKGKSFAGKTLHFYAQFENIQGLANSNPVVINGKQIGTVATSEGGRDMRKITVTMNMSQPLDIPDNSVAIITPSIIGTTSIEIKLGNSNTFYKDGDTISTKAGAGMFDETLQKIDPVLFAVKNAVGSLDSVLLAVNSIFDAATKNNIRATMENLNKSTASLKELLDSETGAVAKTLNNLSSFTGALAKNNGKIDSTLTNLDKTTANLANLDLQKTLSTLDETINELKTTMTKVNSQDGTLGKLVNNASLYNNLNATSNKINLLLDDIRVHPKRYVNISVFGKKSVEAPLNVPTPDTVNAPYTHP